MMEFYVNPYDGVPVYLQIIQLVRNGVALGTLHPGDQLPTVRELAVKLAVNPNTVAKAYRDLEREGMVETVSGKGTVVREGRSASRQNVWNTWWKCWSSRLATLASRLTTSLNDLRDTDSILRKTMTREEVHECDRNDWRQQVVWTSTGAGRHVPDCPDGQHLRPDGAKWLGQDDQH